MALHGRFKLLTSDPPQISMAAFAAGSALAELQTCKIWLCASPGLPGKAVLVYQHVTERWNPSPCGRRDRAWLRAGEILSAIVYERRRS